LANVTYVPIGYLTTKGQTIKVFSQILRKARQMEFLVPHTNFNEDANPIQIKAKDPHPFDSKIGEYIDVDLGQHLSYPSKRVTLSGKIHEIIDEFNFVILSDTELSKEYYNREIKYKSRKIGTAARMWSSEDSVEDSFTGATVLTPKCGMYTDNVAILDFQSLYPTCQISRNLCYSTLVMDDKYLGIDGVNYETIAWKDEVEYKLKQTCQAIGKSGKSKGLVCGKQAFFDVCGNYFCRVHDPIKKERGNEEKYQKKEVNYSYTIVQPHTDENGNRVNVGVVPALLTELFAERKRVKKLMAKAQDEGNYLLADIMDSTQLAIKVSLNSVYGFLGRNRGNLICKPLGQLTTAIGRMLIEQSRDYAEGDFQKEMREKQVLKHQIKPLSCDLTKSDKEKILKRFKV
jgi:DNA polymerase elongation subunit (family B)